MAGTHARRQKRFSKKSAVVVRIQQLTGRNLFHLSLKSNQGCANIQPEHLMSQKLILVERHLSRSGFFTLKDWWFDVQSIQACVFLCLDVFFCPLLFQNITDYLTDSDFLHLSVSVVLESLPPARYRETISILLAWLQQCEAKLAIPSTAVTEYPIMEQRLKDVQVHRCTYTQTLAAQELMYHKWGDMTLLS